MAHLLRTKSLFPNKRMGNVVAREDVQSVKRVCTDWTRCVSESECDSERETEYSTKQPNKQQITATRQRKKKRMTMTKEEKALEVAANIRGRMGFQQELLFRGKGKDSHQCFHSNVFVCGEQKGRDNRRDGDGSRISMAFEPSARMASTPRESMADKPSTSMAFEPSARLASEPRESLADEPSDSMADEPRESMAFEPSARMASTPRESMADKPSTSMAFEPSARLAFEPRESMTDEPKESSMALEPSARMAFEPRESMADEPNNSNSLASEPNNNGNENWWSWEDPPHEHTVHMRPPVFASGQPVTGSQVHRRQWKKDNKRRRQQQQLQQPPQNYWTTHDGCYESNISFTHPSRDSYRGGVCPSNLALKHPAAPLLNQYATDGCPVNTGRRWSRREIEAAAEYGNHPMTEEAATQFYEEALDKEQRGLVDILDWEELKQLPDHLFPADMKLSPLSAVEHKSRKHRAILDLTWMRKDAEGNVPSVNANTTKLAPRGSMDQIGHALDRIIHAVATAPEGKKIYFAKWDVKDGFWQMVAKSGAEWNFCYMLIAPDGTKKVVKPSSLQMGWVDSPGFFGVASETARDVSQVYAQTPFGKLPPHKFEKYTETTPEFQALPESSPHDAAYPFTLEVYVDDFIGAVAACSKRPLRHVGRATLHGIHDVFPPADKDEDDPNSLKKLKKGDGAWALNKDLLGFDFDGDDRTMIVGAEKRKTLADTLKGWTRLARSRGTRSAARIKFKEFRKVICQLRHAARSIPSGRGLLSNASTLASKEDLSFVFVRVGTPLFQELDGWRALLNSAMAEPTKCTELVTGHPDIIGIVDASKEGVGGVVVGENMAIVPVVFRLEWPQEVRALVISDANPNGKITNSDLECAGGLLLWLVIEQVVPCLNNKHVGLLNDNSPTISWLQRMNSRHSKTAAAILRVLAMRLRLAKASPIIPMHIPGVENAISDIPSRSFGKKVEWHCNTDSEFLTLFNQKFPLPSQNSWTVYQIPKRLSMRVISILLTQASEPHEWSRLQKTKTNTLTRGVPMHSLWEWTLTCRSSTPSTSSKSEQSQDSQLESRQATTVTAAKLALHQSIRLSQPLARRFPWTGDTTHSK